MANEMRFEIVVDSAGGAAKIKQFGREVETSAEKSGRSLGDMNSRLAKTADLMAGLVKAAAAAGITAFGAGVAAVTQHVDDLQRAQAKLTATTGATAKEVERLGKIADQVWRQNVGGSVTENAEVAAQAFQKFKDAGDEALTFVTKTAIQLRDAFGDDTQKIISSASTLVKEFGLTHQQAMDFITRGYQDGLNSSGDFLDSIQEYGVQFSDAKLGADQFFSVMKTGMRDGVLGTDKAADMFKEFSNRIIDGSKLTKESLASLGVDSEKMMKMMSSGSLSVGDAFQEIVKKLAGMDDKVLQSQISVGLFGTQFEDLRAKAALSIDSTAVKMKDMEGATKSLDAQYQTFGGRAMQVFRELQGTLTDALGPQTEEGMNSLLAAMEGFGLWVQDNKEDIRIFFGWIGEGLKSVGEGGKWAWKQIEEFGQGVITMAVQVDKAVKEVQAAWENLDVFGGIKEKGAEALGWVKDLAGKLGLGAEYNVAFTGEGSSKLPLLDKTKQIEDRMAQLQKKLGAGAEFNALFSVNGLPSAEAFARNFDTIKKFYGEWTDLTKSQEDQEMERLDKQTAAFEKAGLDKEKILTWYTARQTEILKAAHEEELRMEEEARRKREDILKKKYQYDTPLWIQDAEAMGDTDSFMGLAEAKQRAEEIGSIEEQVRSESLQRQVDSYEEFLGQIERGSEDTFNKIADGSIRTWDDMVGHLGDMFIDMLLELASKDFGGLVSGLFSGGIGGLWDGITGLFSRESNTGGFLGNLWDGVTGLFGGGSGSGSDKGFFSGIADTVSGWFGGDDSEGGGFFSGIKDTVSGWFGGGSGSGPGGLMDYVGGIGGAVGLASGAWGLLNRNKSEDQNDIMSAVDTLNQVTGENGLLGKAADTTEALAKIAGASTDAGRSLANFSDDLGQTADKLTGITSSVTGYATAVWNAYQAFQAFGEGNYAAGTVQGLSSLSGGMTATAALGSATGTIGPGASTALTSAANTIGAVGAVIAMQNMATGGLDAMSYGTDKYQLGNVFSGWGSGSGEHGDMWNEPWREWLMQQTGAGPGSGAIMDMQIRSGDYGKAAGNLMTDTALYWFMPLENTVGNILSENVFGGGDFGKFAATSLGFPTGGLFGSDVNTFTMSELVKGSTMDQGSWTAGQGLGSAAERGEYFASGQAGDHWYNQIAGTYYKGIAEIAQNYNGMVATATADMPDEIKSMFDTAMGGQDWSFDSLLQGTWEVPDANSAIQAIWTNYSKQLSQNFSNAMGVISDQIGGILENVVQESGIDAALTESVDKFGLVLDEKIVKYAGMADAVKLAAGGVTEDEGMDIIRRAQGGYIASGGDMGGLISDQVKEGLSAIVSGDLSAAFDNVAKGLEDGADVINKTAAALNIPVESLADLVSGDALTAAGSVLVGLADTWANMNAEIDQFIGSIDGQADQVNLMQQAMADVDQYFGQHISTLEQLGFTEAAITEIEAKRAEALDKVQAVYAGKVEGILNDSIGGYMADLTGSTNQMADAVADVQGKFKGWIDEMVSYGASADQVADAWGQGNRAVDLTIQSFADQRAEIMATANAMAGYTQTISSYDQALASVNTTFDDMADQMRNLGASVEELTQLEALRAQALENAKTQLEAARISVYADVASYMDGLSGIASVADPVTSALHAVDQFFDSAIAKAQDLGATESEITTLENQRDQAKAMEETRIQEEAYAHAREETLRIANEAALEQQRVLAQTREEAAQKQIENAKTIESVVSGVGEYLDETTGKATAFQSAMDGIDKKFGDWEKSLKSAGAGVEYLEMLEKARLEAVAAEMVKFAENIRGIYGEVDAYMAEITGTVDPVQQTLQTVNDRFGAWRDQLIDNGATQKQLEDLEKKRLRAVRIEMENLITTVSDKFQRIRDDIEFSVWSKETAGTSSAYMMQNLQALMGAEDHTFDGVSQMADMLVQWYDAAVSEAETAARDVANAASGAATAFDQTISKTESLMDHIQSIMDGLKYSEFNLDLPKAKLETAVGDYDQLLESARSGGEQEIKEFTSFINTYLQAAKAEHASSQQFIDIYDQVMSDLGSVNTDLAAGNYEERLATAAEQTAAMTGEVHADLTQINQTFEELSAWIEDRVRNLEDVRMILDINWGGLEGDAAAVIGLLSDVVAEHGWDSEVTLTFVSEMATNFVGTFENQMKLMNFVVDESGGWGSEAALKFIADNTSFSTYSVEQQMELLGYVGTEAGWTGEATMALVTNLSDAGLPWASVKQTLESHGVADATVTKQILGAYYSSVPDFNTWDRLAAALNAAGLDDVTMKTVQAQYTGNMSMAELHSLLSAAGVSDNVIATINEQVRADVQTDVGPGIDSLGEAMQQNTVTLEEMMERHLSWLGPIYDRMWPIYNLLVNVEKWTSWLKPIYDTRVISNSRGYAMGGIASGPATGYSATLHGTELIVSPKSYYPATVVSGGDGSAGDRRAERDLLQKLIDRTEELIDTLDAKEFDPSFHIEVDSDGYLKRAEKRINDRQRRGIRG